MELEMMSSGSVNEQSGLHSRDDRERYLVWEHLEVVHPKLGNGTTRTLLNRLTGFAQSGHILAIMGPSGSGKSTLLDSLAGRLSEVLVMTGNVLLNGRKRSIDCRGISYVTQEDDFLGTLTVRETITYSAHLRLPSKMTKNEIDGVVEKAIMEMGLQDCADTKIGNWHLRGISSGEKKRLSICLEILTHPQVLLLDEPTSRLDSASAFFVIRALQSIACDGRIVVCSIHQPSSDVFDLFDDLLILSKGEAVYFGEAKMGLKFFSDAGFPCPERKNPAEHFLRCISSDFDAIAERILSQSHKNIGIPTSSDPQIYLKTAEIEAILVEKYKCSDNSLEARRRIKEIALLGEVLVNESDKVWSNGIWWKQLCTLTHRSFLNMWRDMSYYWIRIIFYILLSTCIGTIYLNIGNSYWAIWARKSCDTCVYGFMFLLSIGGFPSIIEEMKAFYRERLNGHYGEAVFVLSNFLSSLPFLAIIGLSSGTIIYFTVKFQSGFSHYAYYSISLFFYFAVMESCMMVVASLVTNPLMGITAAIGVIGSMMVASDILRPLPELPKFPFRYPMSYISFTAWALQGQHKNDMMGLEFDPLVPGDPKLKGEIILQTTYGIQLDYSKWWDLVAVMFLLLFYRLLFFTLLKYKERASSGLHRLLYSKRSLMNSHLERRPSLRREPFILSKRHQPLHSLSSQEGLTSPLS